MSVSWNDLVVPTVVLYFIIYYLCILFSLMKWSIEEVSSLTFSLAFCVPLEDVIAINFGNLILARGYKVDE